MWFKFFWLYIHTYTTENSIGIMNSYRRQAYIFDNLFLFVFFCLQLGVIKLGWYTFLHIVYLFMWFVCNLHKKNGTTQVCISDYLETVNLKKLHAMFLWGKIWRTVQNENLSQKHYHIGHTYCNTEGIQGSLLRVSVI